MKNLRLKLLGFVALLLGASVALGQQQVINIGTGPNMGNGDQFRTLAIKDNANTAQLYGSLGPNSQLKATGLIGVLDLAALWNCGFTPQAMLSNGSCGTPGTVTSVGLADLSTTPIFGITNTPVVGIGTLDLTLKTQNANLVFAGPITGGAAQPSFRALVSADLPLTITGLTSVSSTAFVGALTGNATTSTTATSATNLLNGAAGSIPYQTGAGATSMLATASGVLVGGTTPAWSTTPTLTGTNFSGTAASLTTGAVTTTASSTNSAFNVLFGLTSSTLGFKSSGFTFNPSTGALAATSFTGNVTGTLTGNASTATALAAAPSGCTNQFMTSIAASGNANCSSAISPVMTGSWLYTGNTQSIGAGNSGVTLGTDGNSTTNAQMAFLNSAGQGWACKIGALASGDFDCYTMTALQTGFGDSWLDVRGSPSAITSVWFNLPVSTSAQSGYVCHNTNAATGETYDGTNTCLVSSIRYKQDVQPIDEGLDAVMKLRPITYELKDPTDRARIGDQFKGNAHQIGFIAEEVQKIDPRLTPLDAQGLPRGVEYAQMTALLAKAIQQQQHELYALWIAVILLFTWSAGLTIRGRIKP